MIRNLPTLQNKSPSLTNATSLGKNHLANSVLIQQNPILHQSNRIVTAGLLSSYTSKRFAFQTVPLQQDNNREWISDVPLPTAEQKEVPTQREPDLVDEFAAEQPQFTLYEKRVGFDKHAVRFSYSTTMRTVFIEYATKKTDNTPYPLYDWANKTSYRATLSDLGVLLTVLSGNEIRSKVEKVIDGQNVAVEIAKNDKSSTFTLCISKPIKETEMERVIIKMEEADSMLLTEFVRCAVRRGLGFS